MSTLRCSAVLVAAGQSRRFNQSRDPSESQKSKNFVELQGRPLLLATLEAISIMDFHEMVIVVRPEDEGLTNELVSDFKNSSKIKIVHGGRRRQDSVRFGIEALGECDRVYIHDAARPFLSPDFLGRLKEASLSKRAIIPSVPIVETVKEVDGSGKVMRTHKRETLVRIQTPQVFEFSLIKKIHRELAEDDREFTDDAAMLEAVGEEVWTCRGDLRNIKVTYAEDIEVKNG